MNLELETEKIQADNLSLPQGLLVDFIFSDTKKSVQDQLRCRRRLSCHRVPLFTKKRIALSTSPLKMGSVAPDFRDKTDGIVIEMI